MVVMAITVKDLLQYNANFDPVKIRRLTGKTEFKKSDTIDLTKLIALNDNDLSIFVAKKEGKSFVNSILDDNMRSTVADGAGIKGIKNDNSKQNQNNFIPNNIPMDVSIMDIAKQQKQLT